MITKNRNTFDSNRDNEQEKIELCQSGNSEAFSFLVEKYKNLIYQLALRMTGNFHDSEDIAQEAFLKAYRSCTNTTHIIPFPAGYTRLLLIYGIEWEKDFAIPLSPPADHAMKNRKSIFSGDDSLQSARKNGRLDK